jgi:hypothetical protein
MIIDPIAAQFSHGPSGVSWYVEKKKTDGHVRRDQEHAMRSPTG